VTAAVFGWQFPHLHDLVLELGQEEVDDLVLLDGERVQVDLLHALDLAGLYETAELGDGLPLLLVALAASTASAAAATATPAAITSAVTTRAETTATVAAGSTASISHVCDWDRRVEGDLSFEPVLVVFAAVVRSQLAASRLLGKFHKVPFSQVDSVWCEGKNPKASPAQCEGRKQWGSTVQFAWSVRLGLLLTKPKSRDHNRRQSST